MIMLKTEVSVCVCVNLYAYPSTTHSMCRPFRAIPAALALISIANLMAFSLTSHRERAASIQQTAEHHHRVSILRRCYANAAAIAAIAIGSLCSRFCSTQSV